MMGQGSRKIWDGCVGSALEAFRPLPARYVLAAALLLPLAILASAFRLALGWAADRFVPQKA